MSTHLICLDPDAPADIACEHQVVENDYVLTTDGTCHITHVRAEADGAHTITVTGRAPADHGLAGDVWFNEHGERIRRTWDDPEAAERMRREAGLS